MPNAAIWLVGAPPYGPIRKISLPPLSDLHERPVRREVRAESISGRVVTTRFSARIQVEVRIGPFRDDSLRRRLETVWDHLLRGGLISLSADEDITFAAFTSSSPSEADTEIRFIENLWYNLAPATPIAGDEICIQTPSPDRKWEPKRATGTVGGVITLAGGLKFDYASAPWCMVRARHFYPFLRLAPGAGNKEALQHTSAIHHMATWLLEEDPAALEAASLNPGDRFEAPDGTGLFTGPPDESDPFAFDPVGGYW